MIGKYRVGTLLFLNIENNVPCYYRKQRPLLLPVSILLYNKASVKKILLHDADLRSLKPLFTLKLFWQFLFKHLANLAEIDIIRIKVLKNLILIELF